MRTQTPAYWTRTGTVISTATAGDDIHITGNFETTSWGRFTAGVIIDSDASVLQLGAGGEVGVYSSDNGELRIITAAGTNDLALHFETTDSANGSITWLGATTTFGFSDNVAIAGTGKVSGNVFTIEGVSPQLRLEDTTANQDDFVFAVNSDKMEMLSTGGLAATLRNILFVTGGSHATPGRWGILTGAPQANLSVNGTTRLGDDVTNYLGVDAGGRVLLHGTAQTWEDLRIVPGAFQFAGAADPTLESWQPGGAGATYKVYKFKKNDEVFFTCQLPHAYKEGSDLKAHLHWTPCDRGNEENGNTVGWKADYSWANTDAVFAASVTADLSDACSGTDDQHELTSSVAITGTGKTISSVLTVRLYRSDTGADDTWVSALAAQSPAILEFDLHYEIDSLGSDLELTKDPP